MKRVSMIKNQIVENVVRVEEGSNWNPDGYLLIDTTSRPEICPGWTYVDGSFVEPVRPQSQQIDFPDITPRQIRLALLSIGVYPADIDAALENLSEPEKSEAIINWKYAIDFKRDNPLVEQVGAMIGKTAQEIDDLWIYASTL